MISPAQPTPPHRVWLVERPTEALLGVTAYFDPVYKGAGERIVSEGMRSDSDIHHNSFQVLFAYIRSTCDQRVHAAGAMTCRSRQSKKGKTLRSHGTHQPPAAAELEHACFTWLESRHMP